MVEIHALPTTGEVIWARLHIYFGNPTVQKLLAATLALAALFRMTSGRSDSSLALPVAIMWLLVPFAVAMGGIRSKGIKDLTRHGVRYRLSDAGVAWQFATNGSSASGEHDWSRVKRVKETSSLFLLFASATVVVLPKRALASEADHATLRQLLGRHVKDAALQST